MPSKRPISSSILLKIILTALLFNLPVTAQSEYGTGTNLIPQNDLPISPPQTNINTNTDTNANTNEFANLPSDPTNPNDLPDAEPTASNDLADADQQAVIGFASGTSGGVPTQEQIAAEAVQQTSDLGIGNGTPQQPNIPVDTNVNAQSAADQTGTTTTTTTATTTGAFADDRDNPNLNHFRYNPATAPGNTDPIQRIKPPIEIAEEIATTYSSKLTEARQRKYPNGYPGPDTPLAHPPYDFWTPDTYTSLIIRPETWMRFFDDVTMHGYGDSDLVVYTWWMCSNIQNYRKSLDELIISLNAWLQRTDKALAKRLTENWTKYGQIMRLISNRKFGDKGKATGDNAAALCDTPGGFLAAPTAEQWNTSKKGRQALEMQVLKDFMNYQQLAPNEILVTDLYFVEAFQRLVNAQRMMVEWLNNDFTPLIRDINAKCCSKRNLLANTNMRPAGIYDRKALGYKTYWHEKYGKIYRYIPLDFPYWRSWNDKKVERIPDMLETLIYATHATAAGLARGALPFGTEIFVDLAAKVWSLGQYAGIPDPEFGFIGANQLNQKTSFKLSPKFMLGAAERGSTHFMYGAEYPSLSPVGVEFWDDEQEMAKNRWRDQELERMREDQRLFDKEKAALVEPEPVPILSGPSTSPSTGSNTPQQATTGKKKAKGKGTQYRLVKKPG
ncbi:hypothetical protein TWF730_011091 [Orbilia blumenaviensis]|uniref:Uncharacterized protein n=1 Tax=Orbilia blumenaviensis TaxID=1796055 RepID=A0AAV9UJN8_9PEZI